MRRSKAGHPVVDSIANSEKIRADLKKLSP